MKYVDQLVRNVKTVNCYTINIYIYRVVYNCIRMVEILFTIKYYTGCHRRNGPNFGRVFLMLNYTDITQNTHVQS